MNWKSFVSAYLTFGRKDRLGVLTLLILIIMVYMLPFVVPSKVTPPLVLDDSLKSWVDSSQKIRVAYYHTQKSGDPFYDSPSPSLQEPLLERGALFAFDPNTLDADGWMRLGLRERTARTIINYRNKGGKFYKKEDLQKIWGLPAGFYKRVSEYIILENNSNENKVHNPSLNKKPFKNDAFLTIDINTADTTEWKMLPGIGSKLASRIVHFRSKLGGFTSIDQVGTTYGLSDTIFQIIKPKLKINEARVNKIKINVATKEELSAHPYISWKLASSIVAYRQQHGPFKNKEDLKQLMILDEITRERLLPYLQFDQEIK